MTKQLSEMTIEELGAHMADVFTVMRHKAYSEGYEQAKTDIRRFKVNPFKLGECKVETPQQEVFDAQSLRDRIVEQAKADVGKRTPARFVVNKEKRTIVALYNNVREGRLDRGIAKCTPADCFNEHIGKAISLRRALGLEVPAEYLNVPNPTEVRVGNIVEYDSLLHGLTHFKVTAMAPELNGSMYGKAFHAEESVGWLGDKQVKIIDDSRSNKSESETK